MQTRLKNKTKQKTTGFLVLHVMCFLFTQGCMIHLTRGVRVEGEVKTREPRV